MESNASHNVSVVCSSSRRLNLRNHRRRSRLTLVVVGWEYLVRGRCRAMRGEATTILQPKTCRKLRWCRRVTTSRTTPGRRTLVIRTRRITLHKPRCVVVGGPNQQWQADLVDVSRLKKTNDGTTFLLTVIDVFSKRAWCIPLKNKSAVSLVAAPLLSNKAPITLQTDKGSEFLNRALQKLLKEYGVHHFATHNEETKASIVERFNRTLNTRLWRYFTKKQSVRYIDVLQDFVRFYNNTFHRAIGMAPSEVNATSQEEVWQHLYGHESVWIPKYRVGDCVRISKATVQERLHGKLDRRVVYDRRRAPFRATGLPPGGLTRRTFGGDLLRTRTTEGCCVKR